MREKTSSSEDILEKKLDYEMKIVQQQLTDVFVQFFVSILGNYRYFIKGDNFDKEKFVNSQTYETQEFINCFIGSQMFERFIEERLHGLSDQGFEKKIDHYEKVQAQLCKLGFGEEQVDSVVPQFTGKRPNSKRTNLKNGWSTLRNQFKNKDSPDDTIIGTPTLVLASSDRAGGKPLPPPKPKGPCPPIFNVPNKPFPIPPNSQRPPPNFTKSNSQSTFDASARRFNRRSAQLVGIDTSSPPKPLARSADINRNSLIVKPNNYPTRRNQPPISPRGSLPSRGMPQRGAPPGAVSHKPAPPPPGAGSHKPPPPKPSTASSLQGETSVDQHTPGKPLPTVPRTGLVPPPQRKKPPSVSTANPHTLNVNRPLPGPPPGQLRSPRNRPT